ncbi:MAG: hypothetical protein GPJ54_17860 [Candidatus Heimdallarchaeota archaeon]|nr:hypothetical protein [Candidatus Heimdallarchaeota archaeon]
MNYNHKLIKIVFIMLYALSVGLVPSSTSGEGTVIPEITGNGPQINGNLTTEWEDSIRLETNFNGESASIFVQVNGDTVFIGFNYTSSSAFISVNDTEPVNSTIDYNSVTKFNNATHDWLVLQFDNNLDRENIGTAESPDDVISIDQYRNETFDGIIAGNTTHPFLRDVNTTLGGTDDVTAFRSNYSDFEFINDIDQVEVFTNVYEFSKPIASGDNNGSDLNLATTNILQFKLLYWMNSTANSTIDSAQTTEWFTLRLNDTGTGIATKSLNETRLDLLISDIDSLDFSAFSTVIDQYGFDLNSASNSSFINPATNDLTIIVLGSSSALSISDVQKAVDQLKIGGSILIFLNNASSISSSVAELFGLTYLNNGLIATGTSENESSSVFDATATSEVAFPNSPSSVTNRSISTIELQSNAFNITELNDKDEHPFVLSQDYHLYDLFDLPADLVYDADSDGIIGENETLNGISAGVAIDLQKGGRVALFPTSDIISNENFAEGDFLTYLLRLLPWNAKTMNTLLVQSLEIDTNNITPGNDINLDINVTDGFGDVFDNAMQITVTSNLLFGGNVIKTTEFSGSGSIYTAALEVTRTGFMTITTLVFLEGYGFVEGDKHEIVSESSVNNFNDLDDLSFVLVILFLATIAIVALTYFKTK